jgi:hypothetical protein
MHPKGENEMKSRCEIPRCQNEATHDDGYSKVCDSCEDKIRRGQSTYLPPSKEEIERGDGYGDPRHDDPRNYRDDAPLGVRDANEI